MSEELDQDSAAHPYVQTRGELLGGPFDYDYVPAPPAPLSGLPFVYDAVDGQQGVHLQYGAVQLKEGVQQQQHLQIQEQVQQEVQKQVQPEQQQQQLLQQRQHQAAPFYAATFRSSRGYVEDNEELPLEE